MSEVSLADASDDEVPHQDSRVRKTLLSDLIEGLGRWRMWTALAWYGLTDRYKRTWLGISWISLSFAMFAGVKIFIFGALADADMSFFAGYLALGYLSWRMITGFITGGSGVFVGAQNWIRSEPLPFSVYPLKLIATGVVTFCFHAIPALGICLFFGVLNPLFLLCLPFVMVVYLVNGFWVSTVVGIVCARYRDGMHFLTTVMMVLYFVTPILWVPPETGIRAVIAKWNPFAHFVDILRMPALNGVVPWDSWLVVSGISVSGCIVAYIVFALAHKRLVFWL